MARFATAAEAVGLISSFDKVYIQGSTSTPEVLVDALVARAHELRGVELYTAFAVGSREAPYAAEQMYDSFRVQSFFVANNIRRAVAEGRAQSIPCFLGEVPALLRSGTIPLDAVLLNVSTPDRDGWCSYGISGDIAVSAVECARLVIAQVNRRMPHTYGDSRIHIDRIDAWVEVDQPLVALPVTKPNEVERRIGNHIAALVPDGATLQIGVGGIPNAVLDALRDHRHLGLHTEAITDGVVPLIRCGVIDNSQKRILAGKSVGCLALGSERLYDYLDYNSDVVLKDVAWTNDPFIIMQNDNVAAVNSAIEVDLTGQVCADSIGTVIFSGVGGQHDFMYGGARSKGGRTFIALPSTTSKGKSKIVATLATGAGVITTRPQTQYVVTEWGAACLTGKNLLQRARALTAIADPAAREELERATFERFGRLA